MPTMHLNIALAASFGPSIDLCCISSTVCSKHCLQHVSVYSSMCCCQNFAMPATAPGDSLHGVLLHTAQNLPCHRNPETCSQVSMKQIH